ncbi:MAG TPA: efflux RND transporter periplasmic adaptor subunit [Spirochaetia bacterium]|nr:efflux RND transporter periplasmic adaptor subunit [Spirochaetia bacterium]
MSRRVIIGSIVAFGLLGVLGIAAYFRYQDMRYVVTNDAMVDGNQNVVSATQLGRISRMSASEGQRVSRGQPLFALDERALADRVSQAQISVESAAKSVSLMAVRMKEAASDLARVAAQYSAGIIPLTRYDEMKRTAAAAQVKFEQAKTLEQAAGLQLQIARKNLSDSVVKAPADGIVAKRWKYPGDVVSPGQTVYTLFNLDELWVDANIEETRIRLIRPGSQVEISADAIPGRIFSGTVERIEAGTAAIFSPLSSSNSSGNFTKQVQRIPVRIALTGISANGTDRGGTRLLPGMSVTVRVDIGGR